MEYLQGRALTNAIGNLDIQGAYADALNNLGHKLEEIVEQVIILSHSLCIGLISRAYIHVVHFMELNCLYFSFSLNCLPKLSFCSSADSNHVNFGSCY